MDDNFIYEEQKQLIKMWKEHCEEIKQQRDTLQSNWNSLREWLKENEDKISYMEDVLDKMNELEGEKDENI